MDAAWGGGSPDYEADARLGLASPSRDYNLVWADGTDRNHPTKTTNWSGGRRATSDHEPPQVSVSQGRVLFFGDSYIQGYGLSDSETLPWIFQKRHPELNVSNFGSGLYGTYQSYLSMKKSVHEPASVYYLFNSFHEDRNAAAPSFLRIAKPVSRLDGLYPRTLRCPSGRTCGRTVGWRIDLAYQPSLTV